MVWKNVSYIKNMTHKRIKLKIVNLKNSEFFCFHFFFFFFHSQYYFLNFFNFFDCRRNKFFSDFLFIKFCIRKTKKVYEKIKFVIVLKSDKSLKSTKPNSWKIIAVIKVGGNMTVCLLSVLFDSMQLR